MGQVISRVWLSFTVWAVSLLGYVMIVNMPLDIYTFVAGAICFAVSILSGASGGKKLAQLHRERSK